MTTPVQKRKKRNTRSNSYPEGLDTFFLFSAVLFNWLALSMLKSINADNGYATLVMLNFIVYMIYVRFILPSNPDDISRFARMLLAFYGHLIICVNLYENAYGLFG